MDHPNKKRNIALSFPQMSERMKYTKHTIKYTVEENKCGVYLIYNGNDVVYVGKSEDIRERLLTHKSSNEPNLELRLLTSVGKAYFQVIYEDSNKECCRLENILYDYHYHPSCNKQRPESFD